MGHGHTNTHSFFEPFGNRDQHSFSLEDENVYRHELGVALSHENGNADSKSQYECQCQPVVLAFEFDLSHDVSECLGSSFSKSCGPASSSPYCEFGFTPCFTPSFTPISP